MFSMLQPQSPLTAAAIPTSYWYPHTAHAMRCCTRYSPYLLSTRIQEPPHKQRLCGPSVTGNFSAAAPAVLQHLVTSVQRYASDYGQRPPHIPIRLSSLRARPPCFSSSSNAAFPSRGTGTDTGSAPAALPQASGGRRRSQPAAPPLPATRFHTLLCKLAPWLAGGRSEQRRAGPQTVLHRPPEQLSTVPVAVRALQCQAAHKHHCTPTALLSLSPHAVLSSNRYRSCLFCCLSGRLVRRLVTSS